MYALFMYLKDGEYLHLVDKTWGEEESDLEAEAQRRMSLNPNYVSIIMRYKAVGARVVEGVKP